MWNSNISPQSALYASTGVESTASEDSHSFQTMSTVATADEEEERTLK
jgi:hypothetical protein